MPDIHWQVGENAEQETIARITSARRSRRSWLALLLVVVLGIGLGLVYRSIPEPPPAPHTPLTVTPIPKPTATPLPQVAGTIAREAQALAHGDLRTFVSLQDPGDREWLDRQSSTGVFNAWGVPQTGPAYTVVESGTLPYNRAWADVIQFRDGRRFRETRFYRQQSNLWMRIRPVTDEDFWGDWQTMQVGHFRVTFRTRDALWTPLIALRLEEDYQRVCRDLKCAENPDPIIADRLNYRVVLTGGVWAADQEADLDLPSPRILGLYLPDASTALTDQTKLFDQMIYRFLVPDLTGRIASSFSQSPSHTWRAALWAPIISNWELARLGMEGEQSWIYLHRLDLPPLKSLWEPSATADWDVVSAETSAFVKFLDETYGSDQVVHLLHEVGTAQSLPEAINRRGLSYSDLQQKWESWIKQLVESQS